jgi:hypothetical protein
VHDEHHYCTVLLYLSTGLAGHTIYDVTEGYDVSCPGLDSTHDN